MTALTLNETVFVTEDDQEITICLMRNPLGEFWYELSRYDEGTGSHVEILNVDDYRQYLQDAIEDVAQDYPESLVDLFDTTD